MKLNKLEIGMIVKNYKELCDILEVPQKGGRSKVLQLEDLQKYMKYEKEGHKFIIKEILSTQYVEVDDRGLNPNSHKNKLGYKTPYKQFRVPKEHYESIGIYKITLGNRMYVGSTVVGFRERFMRHRNDSKKTEASKIVLHKNGRFEIIEICNGVDEPMVRKREDYWIDHYKNHLNWCLINVNPAWSQTQKRERKVEKKYVSIKILKDDYEKVLRVLYKNNIMDIKP